VVSSDLCMSDRTAIAPQCGTQITLDSYDMDRGSDVKS